MNNTIIKVVKNKCGFAGRFPSLIVLFSLVVVMCGCKKIDHPIAGKTFSFSVVFQSGVHYSHTYVTFLENGKFSQKYESRDHYDTTEWTENHFRWEVDGNNITIRYDNSTTWKPSARGTIWQTGFYNPTNNSVTLGEVTYEYLY